MGFGDDDDILQDFLVEAGEILELLSEQLVDLEQRPDDANLLNAIFRGFHTVKGGAGFLQLNAMVECCHVTENLFDILRNGKRTVTSELMDVVLQALDCVNQQFQEVSQRQELTPATPQLLGQLERLVSCADLSEAANSAAANSAAAIDNAADDIQPAQAATPVAAVSTLGAGGGQGDITDSEFEELLDAISGVTAAAPATDNQQSNAATAASAADGDAISEDEFEALLDQLHGSGKGPGVTKVEAPAPAAATPASDEITDDEFEALLDQLHGSGKAPTVKPAPAAAAPTASNKTDDEINEDEFEALLDQLHGVGKSPSKNIAAQTAAPATSEQHSPASKPASAAKPAAKAKAAPAPKVESKKPIAADDSHPAAKAAPADSPAAGAAAETTVRVDTQRLDDIMNMVGELVLVRNRLVRLGLDVGDEALSKAVSNLDVVTADLQTSVMKTRMQPIKKVFGRFPRVVRDLARHLKKEINLELLGEETDLDKNLVEALADPLVHLVRNSVDHGIEMPADREAKGKSRVGKVILAAQQEGDHILLSIIDDGGGMDPNMLKARAVAKGILEEDTAARMSDSEAFALIFAPGFSTKDQISDISGRGVGMDVVKTKISQLNGSIEIKSKLGEGTSIIIKVPLTLAIMPTLMIMLGRQTFALPLVSVNEIFHMDLSNTNVVDGQECVIIRERAVPIYHLKRWLVKDNYRLVNGRQDGLHEAHVVVVSVGTQRVGFVVDQLIGQEEVVIKPLGKMLQGTPGMAGATITGDGTIALILDVPSMLKRYAGYA